MNSKPYFLNQQYFLLKQNQTMCVFEECVFISDEVCSVTCSGDG